eukprot:CAMPEP_0170558988 /NCGR_PEP_ID=MMETSP0211-20121228/39513_1 /TAXON_ID=311385 /ORGANISM="Pseudokeronopsis sp., Strain OXSARD2" /LENGTH=107 /DNA_ID=CAMNT_0010871541 /DNA_START=632 /DNA_END=955 /DNA_ORIENTATION=-
MSVPHRTLIKRTIASTLSWELLKVLLSQLRLVTANVANHQTDLLPSAVKDKATMRITGTSIPSSISGAKSPSAMSATLLAATTLLTLKDITLPLVCLTSMSTSQSFS